MYWRERERERYRFIVTHRDEHLRRTRAPEVRLSWRGGGRPRLRQTPMRSMQAGRQASRPAGQRVSEPAGNII